jgi:hypothetical protein
LAERRETPNLKVIDKNWFRREHRRGRGVTKSDWEEKTQFQGILEGQMLFVGSAEPSFASIYCIALEWDVKLQRCTTTHHSPFLAKEVAPKAHSFNQCAIHSSRHFARADEAMELLSMRYAVARRSAATTRAPLSRNRSSASRTKARLFIAVLIEAVRYTLYCC